MLYNKTTSAPIFVGVLIFVVIGCCLGCTRKPKSAEQESSRQTIDLRPQEDLFEIKQDNKDELRIKVSLSAIHVTNVSIRDKKFVELQSGGLITTFGTGKPNLPVFTKLIEVPLGATLEHSVVRSRIEEIDLGTHGITDRIVPAQPSLAIGQDRNKVEFYYDKAAYSTKGFIDEGIVSFEDLGILRSSRLFRVEIKPFQYNPEANKLKIRNDLEIRIEFTNADDKKTETLKDKYSSPLFDRIIEKTVPNFQPQTKPTSPAKRMLRTISTLSPPMAMADETEASTGTSPNEEAVRYVLIIYEGFKSADPNDPLNAFINAKKGLGYSVTVAYTSADADANYENAGANDEIHVGCAASSIKGYLQQVYDTEPFEYLLLVGDTKQIPAWPQNMKTKPSNVMTVKNFETDLYYATLSSDESGVDPIPDVFFGRIPANDANELELQINKTLAYEQGQQSGSSNEFESVLVAGDDNDDVNDQMGKTVIDYLNSNYLNPNGHTPFVHLQPSNSKEIIKEINAGIRFAYYYGHGDWDGWVDPDLDIFDIKSMNESGIWGPWISNCCFSNVFCMNKELEDAQPGDDIACFGETAVRASSKCAVCYIGASNQSLWLENLWWAIGVASTSCNGTSNVDPPTPNNTGTGAIDILFDAYGESSSGSNSTLGQTVFAGNLAVSGSTSLWETFYWEIYHLMGDPSLSMFPIPDDSDITPNPTEGIDTDDATG